MERGCLVSKQKLELDHLCVAEGTELRQLMWWAGAEAVALFQVVAPVVSAPSRPVGTPGRARALTVSVAACLPRVLAAARALAVVMTVMVVVVILAPAPYIAAAQVVVVVAVAPVAVISASTPAIVFCLAVSTRSLLVRMRW